MLCLKKVIDDEGGESVVTVRSFKQFHILLNLILNSIIIQNGRPLQKLIFSGFGHEATAFYCSQKQINLILWLHNHYIIFTAFVCSYGEA